MPTDVERMKANLPRSNSDEREFDSLHTKIDAIRDESRWNQTESDWDLLISLSEQMVRKARDARSSSITTHDNTQRVL